MSTSVAVKDEDDAFPVVRQVALNMLERAKGNVDEACALMEREAKKNKELYEELTANFLARACREAVLHVVHMEWRPQSWDSIPVFNSRIVAPLKKGQLAPDPKASNLATLAELNLKNLLDFHLPIRGLPLLRSATREQVLDAAHYYISHGQDFTTKGRWLKLIAEKTPDGKLVGEVFDAKKLSDLKAEAEK